MTAQGLMVEDEVEEFTLDGASRSSSNNSNSDSKQSNGPSPNSSGTFTAKRNPWTPRPDADEHSISGSSTTLEHCSRASATPDTESNPSISLSSSSRSLSSGTGQRRKSIALHLSSSLKKLGSFVKRGVRRSSMPEQEEVADQNERPMAMRISSSEKNLSSMHGGGDQTPVQQICITPSAGEKSPEPGQAEQFPHVSAPNSPPARRVGQRSSLRGSLRGSQRGSISEEDSAFELRTVYPLIEGRLAFTCHPSERATMDEIKANPENFYFSSDCQDQYFPFCKDFGPTSIAVVHSFVVFMKQKTDNKGLNKKQLVYYCDNNLQSRTNAAFLLCSYLIIEHGMDPEEAFAPFMSFSPSPFIAYKHSGLQESDFGVTILECLCALKKAIERQWYSFDDFSLQAYDTLEHPISGNINLVCPKLAAFRSPSDIRTKRSMVLGLCKPSSYVPTFKKLGVNAVVRLNEAEMYKSAPFTDEGMKHHDLFFDDATAPTKDIVERFIEICDASDGMVAVHCLAGLGRTGTMIAAWLIKREGFTAKEAIAWVRLVRPGSIIGNQQEFLLSLEPRPARTLSMPPSEPGSPTANFDPVELCVRRTLSVDGAQPDVGEDAFMRKPRTCSAPEEGVTPFFPLADLPALPLQAIDHDEALSEEILPGTPHSHDHEENTEAI